MIAWMMAAAMAGSPDWTSLTSTSGWKSITTKSSEFGSIGVWHKEIDGIPCLLGTLQTDVPVAHLMEIVMDIPSSTRWSSADLGISETLKRSGNVLEFWQYINIPNWTMVADRFWVLRGERAVLGTAERFRWQRIDAASAYPSLITRARERDSGAVEPPTNWGEWDFVANSEGTQVQYRACADVGGSIPQSIQQWIATRTLPDTVGDVVREAKRRH